MEGRLEDGEIREEGVCGKYEMQVNGGWEGEGGILTVKDAFQATETIQINSAQRGGVWAVTAPRQENI